MFFLLIFVIVILCFLFPFIRYIVFHPISCGKVAFNQCKDYIKHKRKNECKEFGKIVMFCASGATAFGSGKTLSMVRWVTWLYQHYNNLPVWDSETDTFVPQHIIVISNVELRSIPYIPFRGKSQFVEIDKLPHTEHDIIVYCIDEAGMEFNSRQYKDNFSTDFLRRLLQVRHNKCCVCLTSQRFQFTDKILRQTTGIVTTCKMWWRIVRLQDFDAFSLENLPNPAMIKPLKTRFYLATDELFASYDTNYNVETLKQQLADGDLLSTDEILSNIGDYQNPNIVKNKLRKKYK